MILALALICLNRRVSSAQTFAVEPRPVEAGNASLPGSEHRTGIFNPARRVYACLAEVIQWNPISARDGRVVRAQRPAQGAGDFQLARVANSRRA